MGRGHSGRKRRSTLPRKWSKDLKNTPQKKIHKCPTKKILDILRLQRIQSKQCDITSLNNSMAQWNVTIKCQ